jgi:hypothetical protein
LHIFAIDWALRSKTSTSTMLWALQVTSTPPIWQARHGLTPADYQTTFDQLTGEGYYPVLVNGYAAAGGPRFACIFQQGPTVQWAARHGLTAAQYQAAFDDFASQAMCWIG